MKITDEQRERAWGLARIDTTQTAKACPDGKPGPRATVGYLQSIADTYDLGDDDGIYLSGVGGVEPDGSVWTFLGLSSPDELEAHAYGLLLIADEAKARR